MFSFLLFVWGFFACFFFFNLLLFVWMVLAFLMVGVSNIFKYLHIQMQTDYIF